jgi:hypothetical protein
MSQLEQNPFSLFAFRTLISCFFGVLSVIAISMMYETMSASAAFLVGFFSSVFLRKLFHQQIDMAYWWFAIFWELNVKNKFKD